VVALLEQYSRSFSAPVEEETTVRSVKRVLSWYRVTTDHSIWEAPNVVVATGHCDVPLIPEMANGLSDTIFQLVPTRYRNPGSLPDGGVLVVGASASGIQLADELRRAGRSVTLAVGRHTRMPRIYRGRDVMWWLDRMGLLEEPVDPARLKPSLQLVGRPDKSTLDLGMLQERGVRLVGAATGAARGVMSFADQLEATTSKADEKLLELRARIDALIDQEGLTGDVEPAEPFVPVRPRKAPTSIDLGADGITSVLWATGFRRHYPWLKVPVLDARGEIRHRGGVADTPGLYVLGLQFLRRRNSSFIDGVGRDAIELSEHLAQRLHGRAAA